MDYESIAFDHSAIYAISNSENPLELGPLRFSPWGRCYFLGRICPWVHEADRPPMGGGQPIFCPLRGPTYATRRRSRRDHSNWAHRNGLFWASPNQPIKSLIGTIVLFQIVFSSEQEKSVLKVYSIRK